MNEVLIRALVRIAFMPIALGLIVLLPAGTPDFWQVYVYLSAILIPMFLGLAYFAKHDPAALERRMKTKEKESAQKTVILVLGIAVIGSYLIPGFDKRFGWSDIPIWMVLFADAVVFGSYLFTLYVFKVNRFAGRTIEVEQNQPVIDIGPYRWVRHPMYSGVLIMYLATPVALGSWWGLLAFTIVPFGLIARIANEEMVLRRDLAGYADYCLRTRWQLVPGIW